VGSGEFVYSFDIRKENIFVEEVNKKNEDAHFDELSVIKVDPNQCIVAAGDDEGDARLYNYDLECVELLDQGHLNIVNTIEFIKTEKENLCLTAGYDSKIVYWDVQSGKIVREIDLQ
jgi:WD40 repeat protein